MSMYLRVSFSFSWHFVSFCVWMCLNKNNRIDVLLLSYVTHKWVRRNCLHSNEIVYDWDNKRRNTDTPKKKKIHISIYQFSPSYTTIWWRKSIIWWLVFVLFINCKPRRNSVWAKQDARYINIQGDCQFGDSIRLELHQNGPRIL